MRRFTRRQFLRSSALLGAGVGLSLPALAQMQDPSVTPEATPEGEMSTHVQLSGSLRQVHDPVLIKSPDGYHIYFTGNGIGTRKSADMQVWERDFPVSVFSKAPQWAVDAIPGVTNLWAPDISYFNDKYHLYYAASTFGSNRSVIGLATNVTLDSTADEFDWVDEGLVIESHRSDPYNCIDPNLAIDADGNAWLAFGSFWSGIKMVQIDTATGKPAEADPTIHALAYRPPDPHSVEAPFIIRKGDFYYLFVSFDSCCQGENSTYRVMVGRSESITGPYIDRDGVSMMAGGGTQVTFPTDRWRGPGHNGILQEDGVDYIVYHAYDAEAAGTPTMHIDRLVWTDDGWLEPVYPE